MSEQLKDKLINFSNVVKGKNKKNNDRFQLYVTPETAVEMAELLIEKSSGESLGVKLDIHFTVREVKATGRSFESAFMFIKEKQASPIGPSKLSTADIEATAKVSREETKKKIEDYKKKAIAY